MSCTRSWIGCRSFFSSRRRHTRCGRDWSSDVCSSDLWSPSVATPFSRWPDTGNIDAVVLRSIEQGCNGNVQTLGGLQPRRLPAFLQNIPVVAYPRSFVDVVESSRIPFLEELQLFQRGIVISEIRLSEEKASGSIRAADLVQQALAGRPRFAAVAAPARPLKRRVVSPTKRELT